MNKSTTSIVFTGDIGFDRYMDKRWEDENFLSREVLDFFHSADHTCANVEGALIQADDDGSRGIFFHAMDPAATVMLKKINADIWNIANNHIMDARGPGVASTLKIASELGCRTIGAGMDRKQASQPVYLEEAGGIGMIGVCYNRLEGSGAAGEDTPGFLPWEDLETISARIKEIKQKCRWCVVVAHGGEEFCPMPLPYTRQRYMDYLALGADVVVGHHPHVPENYELFEDGKAIFYSLGNFIFDTNYQRAHLYTEQGVLLKLIFTEDKMDFEAMGTLIERGPENILAGPLPAIFTNVPAEEYKLLEALNAAAFLAEDRITIAFLRPQQFKDCAPEVWEAYYNTADKCGDWDGYHPGDHMDLTIVKPLADSVDETVWKQSKLETVKQYLLSLL